MVCARSGTLSVLTEEVSSEERCNVAESRDLRQREASRSHKAEAVGLCSHGSRQGAARLMDSHSRTAMPGAGPR